MVLVYLPTKLGDFVRANVVFFSIPYMEHMGYEPLFNHIKPLLKHC